ncbi:MAG: lipid-A-disaccharide synthase [Acidobacteriota bacterium]
MMAKKITIVSGEESGEKYGAMLVRALKESLPDAQFHGMGGEQMRVEGVHIINDIEKLSVVGFFEVLSSFRIIWKVFRKLKNHFVQNKPDLLILIDFPDFNIRLAKYAHRLGIKIVYFISPQIWAWRKGRVRSMSRLVDRMIVIFPFEVPVYEKAGVRANFVGHPLIDIAQATVEREEMRKRIGVSEDSILVGLLPGSRNGEVKRILPPMLGAARLLHRSYEKLCFMIPVAKNVDRKMLGELVAPYNELPLTITHEHYYDFLNVLDLAVVASGTATVELALMKKPMIVIYRLNPVSYLLARLFVKIENFAMANLIAGKMIVPELLQGRCKADEIYKEVKLYLDDVKKTQHVKEELENIRGKLGEKGVFKRAARVVLDLLEQ